MAAGESKYMVFVLYRQYGIQCG